MVHTRNKQTILSWVLTLVAVVFGFATIKASSDVLFFDSEFRQSVGAFVPIVVWFNLIAGFFYIVAGIGCWLQRRWAAHMALALALTTLGLLVYMVLHVLGAGAYEVRTFAALIFRACVWAVIAAILYRTSPKRTGPSK